MLALVKSVFGSLGKRKSYSERLHDRFASEIRTRLPRLFGEFGARIIPNTEDYPKVFDYAVVILAVGPMLLRFIRGRMDFRVDVTPADKPNSWRECSGVIRNAEDGLVAGRKVDYYGLNDFERFFSANYEILCKEVGKPDWKASTG